MLSFLDGQMYMNIYLHLLPPVIGNLVYINTRLLIETITFLLGGRMSFNFSVCQILVVKSSNVQHKRISVADQEKNVHVLKGRT